MSLEFIKEEIIQGCGQDGIDWVCVKKLIPRQGRVRFSKSWDPAAMPDAHYWAGREMDLINLLSIKHVPNVVELESYSKAEENRTSVVTFDAGRSIYDWLNCPVVSKRAAQIPYPFFLVEEYLKLFRGCLLALKALHAAGFVHCDIKADNICLPATDAVQPGWQCLDYTKLTLIDFAYSISADLPLKKCLPIKEDGENTEYLSASIRRALKQDRKLKEPKNVQRLPYTADLYSLGVMAESLYSRGLAWPENRKIRGSEIDVLLNQFTRFADGLSWSMRLSSVGAVHDNLIKRIDLLLRKVADTAYYSGDFRVGMPRLGTRTRPTPVTPMAVVPEETAKKGGASTGKQQAPVDPNIGTGLARSFKFEPKGPQIKFRVTGFIVGILTAGMIGFGGYWLSDRLALFQGSEKTPDDTPSSEIYKRVFDDFEQEQSAWVDDLESSSRNLRREAAKNLFLYVREDHPEAKRTWESQVKKLEQRLRSNLSDEKALAALKTMAQEEEQHENSGIQLARDYLNGYEQTLVASHNTMSETEFWKSSGKSGTQPPAWDAYIARLRAAAATGDRYAAVWLASLEGRGLGVKQDRANAFKQLFYVLNHTEDNSALFEAAQQQVGALLEAVRIEKDQKSMRAIVSEMERLASGEDHPRLSLWIGALYWDLNDRPQARTWYENAMRSTDSEARGFAIQALRVLEQQSTQ